MPEQKQDILKEHLNQWMLRNAGIYHALEKVEKGEREVREDIEY